MHEQYNCKYWSRDVTTWRAYKPLSPEINFFFLLPCSTVFDPTEKRKLESYCICMRTFLYSNINNDGTMMKLWRSDKHVIQLCSLKNNERIIYYRRGAEWVVMKRCCGLVVVFVTCLVLYLFALVCSWRNITIIWLWRLPAYCQVGPGTLTCTSTSTNSSKRSALSGVRPWDLAHWMRDILRITLLLVVLIIVVIVAFAFHVSIFIIVFFIFSYVY